MEVLSVVWCAVLLGCHLPLTAAIYLDNAELDSHPDLEMLERSGGSSREGRALFSFLFFEKLVNSLVSRVEELESKVAQLESQSSLSVDVEGGIQSYSAAQRKFEAIFSNLTNVYSKIKVNRQNINKKCSKKKCERILNNIDKLETSVDFLQDTNITVLEQMVEMIKNSTTVGAVVSLQTDVDTLKSCLEDPSQAACTSTYSSSSSLPSTLAAKCDQTTCTGLTACMTDPSSSSCTATYSSSSSLPATLAAKCDQTTCTTLTTDVTPIKECMTDSTSAGCTGTYSAASSLPGQVSSLTGDMTGVKGCMADPTSSACTSVYSAAATLPSVLAGKCDATTCTTLTAATAATTACMQDPSSSSCTTTFSSASSLPSVLAGKCEAATCSGLASCMTDPTSTSCSTTYGAATALPAVLAGKCSGSVCTTLTACMTDPSSSSCTGTYSAATTMPALATSVSLLQTCLTTPADAACTITAAASVPTLVQNLDTCMTSVDSAACTASYGASANLVSGGGSGMVGWVQQFRKPAVITCPFSGTSLTFIEGNNIAAAGAADDYRTVADAARNTPANCAVARNYNHLQFAECSHTEPDKTDKTHLAPNAATNTDYVEIKSNGWFNIALTILFDDLSDYRLIKADVFKVSSKNPAASCAAVTEACTTELQLKWYTKLGTSAPNPANSQVSDVTTNNEAALQLCQGDKLYVIVSKSGSLTANNGAGNNAGTVAGVTGTRTILVISKLWYE